MFVTLFDLAGIAMIGWALMILLPGWSVTRRLAEWTLFPVLVALLYAVGVVVRLMATGPGIIADFSTAEGVIGLLAHDEMALVAWIHILAFDHLVAILIYRQNMRLRLVPLPVQSLILFVTLMFGPVGFLAWAALCAGRGRTAFGLPFLAEEVLPGESA